MYAHIATFQYAHIDAAILQMKTFHELLHSPYKTATLAFEIT